MIASGGPHRASTRGPITQVERVRGTQSLVGILAQCWKRPRLIAIELAWRWIFGLPALALLFVRGRRLLGVLLAAHTGLVDFSLQQPAAAARIVAASYAATAPAFVRLAAWVAPLLIVGWSTASGMGRAFLLRELAPEGRFRPAALTALHLLRILALLLTLLAWMATVHWAAERTIIQIPPGSEPSTVVFAAWLICLSLGSFTAWALCSWVLSIAAVLIVVEGHSLPSALLASLRLGRLTAKLVEVNLVLGIVKLALIVLAMVFSSIPLPFETVMSGTALYVWWAVVAVLYLAASDFFQIARLAAFLELRQRGQSIR